MADALAGAVSQDFSIETEPETGPAIGDRELLRRFLAGGEESAFAELVERHSRTVWGVCRRILHHEQDAEDVFQAVFLILARNASSVRKGEAVGSWLYGVAYRVAMKARQTAGRRQKYETRAPVAKSVPEPANQAACRELQRLLDEEVQRLGEKYRKPFVLCYLEGMSKSEAAMELGWKPGTVSGRLAEARKLLQSRLARRGVMLSAVLTAGALAENSAPAAVPPLLVHATVKGLIAMLAGNAAECPLSSSATASAEPFLRTMALAKIKANILLSLVAAALVAGAGLVVFCLWAVPLARVVAQEPQTFLPPPTPLGTPIDEQVFALAFSPDGRKLVTAGALDTLPGQIKMWDVAAGKELFSVVRVPGVRGVAFAPNGRSFATGDCSGAVTLRDANTGETKAVMRGNAVGISAVAYSPDGSLLVSAGLDSAVKLWDVKFQKERRAFLGHTDMVLAVAYFHQKPFFVSGSKDNTARNSSGSN
jgi:RNA polymerase sigma factor (sigma-70 family)